MKQEEEKLTGLPENAFRELKPVSYTHLIFIFLIVPVHSSHCLLI